MSDAEEKASSLWAWFDGELRPVLTRWFARTLACEAGDLAQEVAVQLFGRLRVLPDAGRDTMRRLAWKIAHDVRVNQLRRGESHPAAASLDSDPIPEPRAPDPSLRERLADLCDKLLEQAGPEEQRLLGSLKTGTGSERRLAEQLGTTRAHVRELVDRLATLARGLDAD